MPTCPQVVHGRVEELAGSYDYVLGRAVTALPVFVGWTRSRLSRVKEPPVTGRDFDPGPLAATSSPSPWGLERGILYVKSDDAADDLAQLGLREDFEVGRIQATPLANLLGGATAKGRSAARDALGSRSDSGYSSVLHIPSSCLLKPY